MNKDNFEKMDEKLMQAMKPLREKGVSDGILKGFSASVERRIFLKQEGARKPRFAFSLVGVPVLAVMLLASLVVLRSPIVMMPSSPVISAIDYAQLSNGEEDLADEITALKELGAWDENDDSLLGTDVSMDELELSSGMALQVSYA